MPDLRHGLLCNRKRLSQHSHIAQFAGHHVHVALFIDHKLGHKTVRLFNTALGEIARKTEILVSHTTGAAILMWTGTPHRRHYQVARLDIAHLRTHLDHFTQRLVPNHQVLRASRRSAELERGNLPIGTTHANLQHAQLHLRRRRDLRLLMINQLYLVRLGKNGNSFHCNSRSC